MAIYTVNRILFRIKCRFLPILFINIFPSVVFYHLGHSDLPEIPISKNAHYFISESNPDTSKVTELLHF